MVYPSLSSLWIHDSQSPLAILENRQRSLQTAQINHQFHYASPYQTQLWLDLYQRYSPMATQRAMGQAYQRFSDQAAALCPSGEVHVIGLGAGGAHKDRMLLQALQNLGRKVRFTPLDVSPGLSFLSAQHTRDCVDYLPCPIVADLLYFVDLPQALDRLDEGQVPRLYTFYGMLPNFEASDVFSLLYRWLRPQDFLALSANLAPGDSICAGMNQVRAQYDNRQTELWLSRVLIDWGLEQATQDYYLATHIFDGGCGKFEASVEWNAPEAHCQRLRLFFSYRYTLEGLTHLAQKFDFHICPDSRVVDPTGQEGIWLLQRLGLA